MSIRARYLQEVNNEIRAHTDHQPAVLTEQVLAPLPEPLQRCFRHCGFVGRPLAYNAWFQWAYAQLRVTRSSRFLPVRLGMFVSVPTPVRAMFVGTRLFKVASVDARSTYREGSERAEGRLGGLIRLPVPGGRLLDESALAGLLEEAVLVPGLALHPSLTWVPLDHQSARGIMRHGDLEVSGIFRFTAEGEFAEYDTEHRSYMVTPTTFFRVRSTSHFGEYHEVDGIRVPTLAQASWHLADGESQFFDGEIAGIRYNVREPIGKL